MLIRVPIPRQGIQYERSESRSEEAQQATNEWHQEIREAALTHVSGGLEPIPAARLSFVLCYGPPKPDGLYRPQSLGEAHRLVTHAIRGLIQAGVLIGDASMSATRESVRSAKVQWCDDDVHIDAAEHENIWIQVEE